MKLYAGIDLHSNNSYVVLSYKKRLANDAKVIVGALAPYHERITGIVVESTYNWYWLVDQLQAENYRVHLANTTAIQQYSGLKHTNDKTDAIWLAKLLRLNLLPEGYIYPREERGLRELLRRRLILVRQQTMSVLGIQAMITRYDNLKIGAKSIKNCKNKEEISNLITDADVRIAAQSQLNVLYCIVDQVALLEKNILMKIEDEADFIFLKKSPVLALYLR